MNRPIKYRLRIDNEVVGFEKWCPSVYGSVDGRLFLKTNDSQWTFKYIPHNHKDQFTDLCEIKTRKEIYENDICENQYGWIGTIIWDSDIPLGETVPFTGWWWKCKEEKDGKFPFNVDTKTKIIGNVFQNKDLLEKK